MLQDQERIVYEEGNSVSDDEGNGEEDVEQEEKNELDLY